VIRRAASAGRLRIAVAIAGLAIAGGARAWAQQPGRFLGREEIVLLGLTLEVAPAKHAVPKDVATIVNAAVKRSPSDTNGVSPFPPNAVAKATLRGPSLTNPVELRTAPGTPFEIPPLSVPGIHTLDGIRVEVDGQILMRGAPESAVIEVLEKVLVTQVTTRPLTAQEIRDKGIVFDRSSFQAYNFTAAFAVKDKIVQLDFPIVLPTVVRATVDTTGPDVALPSVQTPQPPNLATIIPDTLRIQRTIPNLSVIGFVLRLASAAGDREVIPPPIPGVVVIPGQIGFLNQFFSTLLMVGNAAPAASGLTVDDLRGEILLPAGRSGVVGAADAPLRMATTTSGPSLPVQSLVQAGADARIGTADDNAVVAPGETATAEYLVEGRREGTHTIEFSITATLHGLPGGPLAITGRAAGAVVVRNPSFSLTFTHPDTVQAGEPYTLDVTVTNTSPSIANIVTVALSSAHLSGAAVAGDATQTIDSLEPQDSATVSFPLISQVSGRVFAATLDGDENVNGRFALKTGVGELNVPVSPDSLVLPAEANTLPAAVRKAALGLLGKAWSVATAPSAALPADVARFSKKIVYDRAIDVAEAGFRISLHEPEHTSVSHLLFDVAGNGVASSAAGAPDAAEREFVEGDYAAFDQLRRRSVRGDVFAGAVGAALESHVASLGAAAFHRHLAEQISWRPATLSVLASTAAGPLPVRIVLVDAAGRATGRLDSASKVLKGIPFSDVADIAADGAPVSSSLALIASLPHGAYRVVLEPREGAAAAPFTLSLVYPGASGALRQIVFDGVTPSTLPSIDAPASDPWRVTVEIAGGAEPLSPIATAPIVEPAPSVVGVVQQRNADLVTICDPPIRPAQGGRIVAVLFNKTMTAAAVDDGIASGAIAHYALDDNQVLGAALQPGRRIVFLALRDPVGPYVPRSITFSNMEDGRGGLLTSQSVPIEATVGDGGVVTGRVLQADGSPVAGADVRLVYFGTAKGCHPLTISARNAGDDGSFAWDYVARLDSPLFGRVRAVDASGSDLRQVDFKLQREAQRLNINVVFLGRGTFKGKTLDEAGGPLAGTAIRITSLTDSTLQFGAKSADDGSFSVARVPVGNFFVEAVHEASNAFITGTERMPFASATVDRNLTLLKVDTTGVTIKYGRLDGHVLLAPGGAAAAGVPVVVYYRTGTQAGVPCPHPGEDECAVATTTTDGSGAFSFAKIVAGQLRVQSFNAATLQQGEAQVVLPVDGAIDFNLIFAGGLGTVRGVVLDAGGQPVPQARVGGGLSLTSTGDDGRFVLTDVPVGRRDIVAVSDALGTKGSASIDIVRAGQEVNVTVVIEGVGSIAGRVFHAGGGTPMAAATVYLFKPGDTEGLVDVIGSAVTDLEGKYRFSKVPLSDSYSVSAFTSDFSDGNVLPAPLRFNAQTLPVDIVFRGRGSVTGTVSNADGSAPLKATVGISGDRVVVAGGLVGVAFQSVKNFAITESNASTGAFAFTGVFAGSFTLQAAGAFSPDPITASGAIPSHGATEHVDLRLTATSRVTGVVVLPDGVTPAGAGVHVMFKSEAFRTVCHTEGKTIVCVDVPQGIQEEPALTDEQGAFVIPLVNAGRFTLTAEKPGTTQSGQVRGQVAPGETGDFTIRLLRQASITVRVRHHDTSPLTNRARVEVRQIGYPNKIVGPRETDAVGQLVLSGGDAFSEGELVVVATDLQNGFKGRASRRVTSDDGAVTIDVFLFDEHATVVGTVFRSDHVTPVSNAEVVISNAAGPLAFVQTDAAGFYTADVIPKGPFTIDVFEAATGRLGFASGAVVGPGEVEVNVFQAAVGLITGNVLSAGSLAPLKLWNVGLSQTAPSGRQLPLTFATSGVDGGFSFPATAGPFVLFSQNSKVGRSVGASGVLRNEGERVDVPLIVSVPTPEFGRVEGVVVDAFGQVVGDAQVRICLGGCDSGQPEFRVTALTDGTFGLDHVPVGRLDIHARAAATPQAGRAGARLAFDGDVTRAVVVVTSLARVTGTVRLAGSAVAPRVRVELTGQPASGCGLVCVTDADEFGRFEFVDVPATVITVVATDPLNGRHGLIVTPVQPGAVNDVTIVLEPSSRLTGRVLTADGRPAVLVTAALSSGLFGGGRDAFVSSDNSGSFAFTGLAAGVYVLKLTDPVGSGVARRIVQLIGADQDLGDVVLDEAAPVVAQVTPASGALRVPLAEKPRLKFSEPLDPASLVPGAVTLIGPQGAVPVVATLSDNDTIITLAPQSPLAEGTRYAIQAGGVRDRALKVIAPAFTSTFTSIDLTPPSTIGVSPPPNATGVTINSTVRLAYSEPIDAARFATVPVVVTAGGATIEGRIDYAQDATLVIFTPSRPLAVGTRFDVAVLAAVDLAGNAQTAPLTFTFTTSDLTPPKVLSLTASPSTVIEGTTTTVTADVGQADVAVVDFYVNDVPLFASRTRPFALALAATPAVGAPGAHVKVSAVATDTSGLRGTIAAVTFIDIVEDRPPTAAITAPADGLSVRNGDRVNVTVRVTDDVGVAGVAYRPATGRPQDAASRLVAPAATDRTETFAFTVPDTLAPGTMIEIAATAVDTRGQQSAAPVVRLAVLDAAPPSISITGTASGSVVRPGTSASAVVAVSDTGGVVSIRFRTSGVVTVDETRAIDPGQPSVAAAFTFPVPSTARPTDALRLDATAFDRAGNKADAAFVVLSIADLEAPRVTLRAVSGRSDAVIGSTVGIVVEAEDEIGVSRIDVRGSGAFAVADGRSIPTPSGSVAQHFTVTVPADATPDAILTIEAIARDVFGNVSAPVALPLTLRTLAGVTLPASVIVLAGESVVVPIELSAPAGGAGLAIKLMVSDPQVATVASPVTIAAGSTTGQATITGVAGGSASITASILDVERAAMTVTVQGAVVTGTVFDSSFQGVSGAQVSVSTVLTTESTTTDSNGNYQILADFSTVQDFTVHVHDVANKRLGVAEGRLNRPRGFAHVTVIVVSAGTITGQVRLADGTTPTPQPATVTLREQNGTAIATTVTNDSTYVFDLVGLGTYLIDASDAAGNRGRRAVTLNDGGQQQTIHVSFLGRNTVAGTVRSGGVPAASAVIRLFSNNIFGDTPIVERTVEHDGTFRFDNVFEGTATVVATDPVSRQAGFVTVTVKGDGKEFPADVALAGFGTVSGTIRGADGLTTVPDAQVTLESANKTLFTLADGDGVYTFATAPTGAYKIIAKHQATRAIGFAQGTLAEAGDQVTTDVVTLPQATVIATVVHASGAKAAGASVAIQANAPGAQDSFTVTADSGGVAVLQNVLAGSYTLTASAGALTGTASGTLAPNATEEVTVTLQPTAAIAGTVFLADGVTPAPAGAVAIQSLNSGQIVQTAAIASDGTYRAEGLPLHPFRLAANDGAGVARAIRFVTLSTPGETADGNVIFTAIGRVAGRVLNPGGGGAGEREVTLQSLNTAFGGFRFTTTNAAGFYEFANVYAGTVIVTASNTPAGTLGEVSGVLVEEGQTLTLDLQLIANAVQFPHTNHDASNFPFDVQQDGSVALGMNSVYGALFPNPSGAFKLEIVRDGAATPFTGQLIGRKELGGAQLVTQQNDIGGLNVTRKVFVPRSHFARYLELLSNPTPSPITVTVRLRNALTPFGGRPPAVIASSSGDAVLSAADPSPDRWLVAAASDDGDPFLLQSVPTLAWTFDGAGARRRATAASLAPTGSFGARVLYEWANVTIEPGAVVGLMHFGVQQAGRAAARASAARLLLLPPEAIDGLSPSEIAAIENFAVPANGVSAVGPLPALGGTISGVVYEADGTTAIAHASQVLRVRSSVPVFARTYLATTNAQGQYQLSATTTAFNGGFVAVPLAPFTVEGRHPQTVVSTGFAFSGTPGPVVPGSFAGGPSVVVNYAFTNTAMLRARVRRADGTVVLDSLASVGARRLDPPSPPTVAAQASSDRRGADGYYRLYGLLPGVYELTATVSHPQGGVVVTKAAESVESPNLKQVDITLPATGVITGIVRNARGAPVASAGVTLLTSSNLLSNRFANTNASGVFLFTDLPAATYTLESTDFASNIKVSAPVTAVANQTVSQDLTYAATGTVTGRVFDLNGAPMPGQGVNLHGNNTGGGAVTDGQGRFTITSVRTGNFTLTSFHPTTFLIVDASGRIAEDGETVERDLRFQGVRLPVTLADRNGFTFNVETDGRLSGSTDSYLAGAYHLSIFAAAANGAVQRLDFPGRNSAYTELGDRQLVIPQSPFPLFGYPPGLKMTRKVYVPSTGYFARYLEIFENTGDAAVTFDAQITVGLPSGTAAKALDTSTGDQSFTTGDRWLVTDKASFGKPTLAHIFAGQGAGLLPSSAGLGFASNFTFGPFYRWNALTLQPGQRIAIMHFAVQQFDREGALAAVDRLEHLAPEAIAGLTAGEIADIATFTVPADGSSPLEPFSDAAETITASGRVFDQNGTTPLPFAPVTFGSANRVFGPPATAFTDAQGGFSLTRAVVDRSALQARHPVTQTPSPVAVDAVVPGQTTLARNIVFTTTGTVRGLVHTESGLPLTGAIVSVSGGTLTFPVQRSAGADGVYLISGLLPATYSVTAFAGGHTSTVDNVIVAAGGTTTQDIVVQADATLRVDVHDPAGGRIEGANVYYQIASEGFFRFAGTISGGPVVTGNVPRGAFTVLARDAQGVSIGSVSGSVAAADEGRIVDVVIRPASFGFVNGRVLAGDGQTGIPFVGVGATDIATGEFLVFASTDETGAYTMPQMYQSSAAGVRIAAFSPVDGGEAGGRDVAFESAGQTLTVDLVLPLAVVHGEMYLADGVTPVSASALIQPQAEAASDNGVGDVNRQSASVSGHAFTFFLETGPWAIRGYDSRTGAGRTISGEITDVAMVQHVKVTLPPTGTIAGVFRNGVGEPVAGATVAVSTSAGSSDVFESTDANGSYAIEDIPLGAVTLQACHYDPVEVCATRSAFLDAAGQTVQADLVLPATGVVRGRALLSDGATLAAGPFDYVHVTAGSRGPLNQGVFVSTAGSGEYTATMPLGPITTVLGEPRPGFSTGTLTQAGPLSLDVTIGAAGAVDASERPPAGDDNFTYDSSCGRGINGGEDLTPYASSYRLKVNGAPFGCAGSAASDLGGRQIAYGPVTLSGLRVTRRVFVPAAGKFARFLETFTNPGAAAVTIDVDIESRWAGVANLFTPPTVTSPTFAVTSDGTNGASGRPSAGHVFAGPGAAVPATFVEFQPLLGPSVFRFRVTVPAGGAVTIMHFTAQRAGNDAAGADAQAQALSGLTDADALTGMSAEDRRQVVNFRIP
jgi:hypothetical protein